MTRLCLIAGLVVIAVLARHPGPQHGLAALAIILGLRAVAQRDDRLHSTQDPGGPVTRKTTDTNPEPTPSCGMARTATPIPHADAG